MSVGGHAPKAVGVLGGSFDPVHSGHLWIADEACRLLGLSRLLLLPTALPPHKAADRLSAANQREAMLRLALPGHPRLEISRLELEQQQVCYTIDTLRRMRDGQPPWRPVFLLGMDSLVQISTWRLWRELIAEFDLAVIDRVDDDDGGGEVHPEVASRIVAVTENAPPPRVGQGGRVFRLPIPPISVSSSVIRTRARAGEALTGLVPPAVARYIHDMGLYRQEVDR